MVEFNQIPGSLRVPLFYAEVNAGGTPFNSTERLLLVGQKLAAGTASLDEPVLVNESNAAEDTLFGAGSMLSEMVKVARKNAPFGEVWALPVTDGTASVSATGTIDFTTVTLPVTIATAVTVYVAGREYNVAVSTTSTATTIGDDLVTALADDSQSAVVGVNAAGVVTLTARHAGSLGNGIDLRLNLYGDESAASGEITVTAMTGGIVDPDLTNGLAALSSESFTWIANPYTDTANLALVSDFMDDVSGRWSPLSQIYGHVLSAIDDTVANLSTKGNALNDRHLTLMGVYNSPSPVSSITAAIAAQAAKNLSDAPSVSRPLQFITLEGILPPSISDRFSVTDKNTLLYDGIATYTTASDGSMQIERLITTYQQNDAGFSDGTFLDIQTLAQTMYILKFLRSKVSNAHGSKALGNDNTQANQNISRPRDIRNTLIAGYQELANLAVVESLEVFEANIVVERNATDSNRVDVYLPIDVINQLRVIAVNATTFLQF